MRLPLFPLHTVLAPGLVLPLHVFEERYRVMVRRCLDTSAPFGVVLLREGSEVAPASGASSEIAIAAVGTCAEIREASRYADGRWDLVVVGTGRFTVVDVDADAEPYLVGEVDLEDEVTGDPAVAAALADQVRHRFIDYLHLLRARPGEMAVPLDVQVEVDVDEAAAEAVEAVGMDGVHSVVDSPDAVDRTLEALRIPDDPNALSHLLAGIILVEPERKQQLLEAATAEERLLALDELLRRELGLLRRRLALYVPGRLPAAESRN